MAASDNKPLILIDGSSYFYRAFHALPPLTNSKGEPTGAVYGVINMIRKLIKDHQPTHIAVVFDPKGKTFRDELYPQYKATREAMPDELSCQFAPLKQILQAMGLPVLIVDGVEADDVIGTLAKQATAHEMKTLISTGDKDMAQLVNDNVTLINTMSNTTLDTAGVFAKFGVRPDQIIDYLTLIGDKSDNVPGVDKVGPKTAAKWLSEYENLDALLVNVQNVKGKVGENLQTAIPQIPLSKQLVTIDQDLDLPFSPEDFIPKAADTETLKQLYTQLEFRSWLSELLTEPNVNVTAQNYQTIFTQTELEKWLKQLAQAKLIALAIEATNLDENRAELVGVAFAVKEGEAAYVPLAHDYSGAPEQLNREAVLKQLAPLLTDPTKAKVGHNLKYTITVLSHYGIEMQGVSFDTMLESYVLNSSASRHDIDPLALKYLGKNTIHFEDIAGKASKQLPFNQIAIDKATPYAAEAADITMQLHQALWPKIQAEIGLKNTFTNIEMPLVSVLSHIERCGVLIDKNQLAQQSERLTKRIAQLEQQVYQVTRETFNLGSPKQLQTILYEKMGLPILQKTPGGQASTAESVLQDLALDYPLPKLILEYRGLSKLKSTYTDALPLQINPRTGRVHTSYNQAVAATGRLSSTAPNLQNIPVRTEEGRLIRQAFIAPQGFKIVAADYSQIELRIMAHLTGDPGLTKAFANGLDIHRATAAEVFGVAVDAVTPEQRRSSKAINFGLIYGMSAFGLGRQLGIERNDAQAYMDIYFKRYPKVREYMETTRKLAHETGYVETLFGRRLNLPEINSRNLQQQRAAERAAINAPLQGTAADVIKIAMINIDNWLQQNKIDASMIMQVHDELVFEVADHDVDLLAKTITRLMETAAELNVPLEVQVGIGNNWDQAH